MPDEPPHSHHDNWLREVLRKVAHRPDLIIGLTVLTVGSGAVAWIGAWGVPWVWRIPMTIICPAILGGMTLGMLHDYTDPDEQDSEAWLEAQRRTRPPED